MALILPIIGCIPVKEYPSLLADGPVTIYEMASCPLCHELMWLGEQSKKMVSENTAKAVCFTCIFSAANVLKLTPTDFTTCTIEEFKKRQDKKH